MRSSSGVRGCGVVFRHGQRARENLTSVQCLAQLDFDALACKASEFGLVAQRAVNARRTDFQPLVVDVLDFKHPRQLAGHLLAVFDAHTADPIDRDAQKAQGGTLDVHEFDVHAGQSLFGQCE
ncbi:hypothetical protein D3C77_564990 [compost metagenome]